MTLNRLHAAFVHTAFMLAVFAIVAPTAQGGGPCWQDVVEDWYDNSRVDGRYEIHCYREALANLPEDMRSYSSAPDDINRALQEALRDQARSSASSGSSSDEDGNDSQATGAGGSGTPPADTSEPAKDDSAKPAKDDSAPPASSQEFASAQSDGVARDALEYIGPSDARSVPIPLIVLAAMAMLLMLAGGAGLLVRRRQVRERSGGGDPAAPSP
ncbi:MAG: hypothetical protein M3377_06675 [Actinomycetota bacterium]|nr:hypothetical protein [Actinomycetota bacterium]